MTSVSSVDSEDFDSPVKRNRLPNQLDSDDDEKSTEKNAKNRVKRPRNRFGRFAEKSGSSTARPSTSNEDKPVTIAEAMTSGNVNGIPLRTPSLQLPRLDAILGADLNFFPLDRISVPIQALDKAYGRYIESSEKKSRLRPRRQCVQPSAYQYYDDDGSSLSDYIAPSSSGSDDDNDMDSDSSGGWTMHGTRGPGRKRFGDSRKSKNGLFPVNTVPQSQTPQITVMPSKQPATNPANVTPSTLAQLVSVLHKQASQEPAAEDTRDTRKAETEIREFVTRIMNGDCVYK